MFLLLKIEQVIFAGTKQKMKIKPLHHETNKVNLRAGACFQVTSISVSICFSVGLFFVTPCKTDSKYKNNYLNKNFSKSINSASNYPFKLYNQNTKIRCEICSKLTIKARQRRNWCLNC